MLRVILVGLDGSQYSCAATELALQWAKRFGARILALGIVDEPTIRRPEPVPLGAGYYKQHLQETRLREAQERVAEFLRRCHEVCDKEHVECKEITDVGQPWEQIVLEAQRCDVVILGKETYFHFETQDEPCDTLYRVLRNSPRPVVAVPEKIPEGETALVAYDGSLQAAQALQLFALLGLSEQSRVMVCSVSHDGQLAKRWADTAAEFLSYHDVRAQVHPITSSSAPAQVILEEARKHRAKLLVMGAYGQPILKEFFLGSVTQKVLRDTDIPLFLYH
ncbi:MAG: universal stress protein [Gemmatales bacterium]|nr:universal stress protein [Gemmatales bacterium]MDW8223442.1 universal stress protein [Gemmatales bacterium]